MMNEISLEEFLRDIRRQKKRIRQQKKRREIEEPSREPWEVHMEALNRSDYDSLTRYGRRRLERPRPVWLSDKERWTVGAPVNPVEWQILIRSEPAYGRAGEYVTKLDVEMTIQRVCGQFQLSGDTFSGCVSQLHDRRLLKTKDGFRHSRIADKWLFPDLTGPRTGGEWHRKSILDYIDWVNQEFGCYTYADRGYQPGVEMPDVITVRPQLVDHTVLYDLYREPLRWDMENPIYAEFKSAQDMRGHPDRLKKQLERYEGDPLYLEVEARVWEVKDMLEGRGRRCVDLLDLLRKAEGDMVSLHGRERPEGRRSFESLLKRIREAFRETYDRKARLKKTGTDPQGRECHDLILYDSLDTPKNVGQVIPEYADDVGDFAGLYFDRKYLGRISTADYIYVPERKPTYQNKTWKWEKRKAKGFKFRSFSV